MGNLTLKKETKQFMKKIVRTIYDEQLGIWFKSRSFLDQLESTPELLPKKETPEKKKASNHTYLGVLLQVFIIQLKL